MRKKIRLACITKILVLQYCMQYCCNSTVATALLQQYGFWSSLAFSLVWLLVRSGFQSRPAFGPGQLPVGSSFRSGLASGPGWLQLQSGFQSGLASGFRSGPAKQIGKSGK